MMKLLLSGKYEVFVSFHTFLVVRLSLYQIQSRGLRPRRVLTVSGPTAPVASKASGTVVHVVSNKRIAPCHIPTLEPQGMDTACLESLV